MKLRSILLAVLLLFIGGAVAQAEVEKSAEAGVDVMSNYVWRGQKLSEGLVVQPTAGLSYNGFGVNLWSNYDFDSDEANETDLTLNYTTSFDKLGVDVGWIYYGLDGIEDTQEIYAGVSYDVVLSPSLTLYWDIIEGGGGFLTASIGHSFPLGSVSLDVGASASVNLENEVMGDFTGLYNGEVSVGTSFPLGPVSINPVIAVSFPLSDDAEEAIEAVSFDGDSTIVYGGIGVSISF